MNYNLMNDMKLKYDYGLQPVGQDMGMFSPGEGKTADVSGILGTVGSVLAGPVGGAVGGAVGGLVSTGSQVSAPGETRDPGGAMAKGAMKGALGGLLGPAADAVAGPAAGAALDAAAGAATDAATDTAMQEIVKTGAGKWMDAAAEGVNQFAANAGDMTNEPSVFGQIYDMAKDGASRATSGLVGGNYESMPDKGSFFANFRQGFKGGGADTAIANLRDGNFGAAFGQAANYTANNYRPPAYDADKFKQKYQIRY